MTLPGLTSYARSSEALSCKLQTNLMIDIVSLNDWSISSMYRLSKLHQQEILAQLAFECWVEKDKPFVGDMWPEMSST